MEYTTKFTNKSLAERFVSSLKERKINPDVQEDDKEITVKYSIAYDEEKSSDNSVTREDLGSFFRYVMGEMEWRMNFIGQELAYLEEKIYKHEKGHLPPIHGAEKMENALNALGIGKDYEVQKPMIRSVASQNGQSNLEVNFPKKK